MGVLMSYSRLLVLVAALLQVACDDSQTTNGVPTGTDFGAQPRIEIDSTVLSDQGDLIGSDMNQFEPDGSPPMDSGLNCVPGEILGCQDRQNQRRCADDGLSTIADPCPDNQTCQAGTCRDSNCADGFRICLDEQTVGECRRDESGYIPIRRCESDSPCVDGNCDSDCNASGKVPSNVGCEYWSVDLDNYPDPFANDPSSIPHAVAISNTSTNPAIVTVEGPLGVDLVRPQFQIEPGAVFVYTFPRLDIDGTGIFDRAFRIRATQPVIVYQFNPLNNEGVASNDASLLLPTEGLGREYIAMSWPTSPIPCLEGQMQACLPNQHGYLTAVATAPGNTTIRVRPTAVVNAGGDIEQLDADIEHEFVLSQGQVLNLEAFAPAITDLGELLPTCETDEDCMNGGCLIGLCIGDIAQQAEMAAPDLTGSVITANQPIAVFGGHEQAVVGEGCCAEHLEQQLFPVSTWGTRYLAARSEPRGGSDEVWRIVAAADNTTITTVPPQPESGMITLNRGDFHEIVSRDSFEIQASAPVMVGQYLVSQEGTGDNVGDPALILAPPIEQLRSNYQVITPEGYSSNWLTVARSAGVPVTLDGGPIAERFTSFGGGQFEIAWIPVDAGVHRLESEEPFLLSIYGYSAAVSYGYPGGLNLRSDED